MHGGPTSNRVPIENSKENTMMKSAALALAIVFAGTTSIAFAADAEAPAKKAPTAQQEKMKKCSAENKGKTGQAYKDAQKACLSDKTEGAAAAPTTQQDKMKKCSAENKGKKGQEYKDAQKACLSS
jgi:hypothetical protein